MASEEFLTDLDAFEKEHKKHGGEIIREHEGTDVGRVWSLRCSKCGAEKRVLNRDDPGA